MKKSTAAQAIRKVMASGLLLGLAATLGTPAARANTYLFTFTTQQVMTALQTSQGPAVYNESAYFDIFVQPDPTVVTSYSFQSETAPNAGALDAWHATTVTDFSTANVPPGTSAFYGKQPTQTSVAVVSGANAGGKPDNNIFLFSSYKDSTGTGSPNYGWGSVMGEIDDIMTTGSIFQFVISTSQTLTGPTKLNGTASALISNSPLSASGIKDQAGIKFSLTATPTALAPEPGPGWLWASGIVFLLGLEYRKRRGCVLPRNPKF
jgi:hypothetical protein